MRTTVYGKDRVRGYLFNSKTLELLMNNMVNYVKDFQSIFSLYRWRIYLHTYVYNRLMMLSFAYCEAADAR